MEGPEGGGSLNDYLLEHGAIKEPPSFFDLVGLDKQHAHFLGLALEYWVPVAMALIVGLLLLAASWIGTRRLERIPGRFQALLEMLVTGIRDFFVGVMGEAAHRYVPFLGALFLYILLMNYLALVPGLHAATSKLSTTAGLAVMIFCVTQIEGIRANGFLGYLKHFAGDFPGVWPPLRVALTALMFPLHIIGELARPLSLSLRLFGNIMGEDSLIAVIIGFGAFLFSLVALPVPLHFPLLFLALLAGLIQALVFALLSAVYIGGAIGAFEEHHAGEH